MQSPIIIMYISMTHIETSATQVNVHVGHLGLLLEQPC